MLVTWTKEHILGPGNVAKIGRKMELPPLEARRKIEMGYAVAADDSRPPAPPAMNTSGTRNADPVVQTQGGGGQK